MRSSHRHRRFLGLVLAASLAVGACGGAAGSAPAGTGGESAPSVAATPVEASPAASPGASGGAAALPEACAAAIRDYLIAIEPVVSGVDWQVATEVPPQVAEQLDSSAFDPEVCPEVSATEAHAAWAAIATDVAPGTLDYIDFIYRP
jgi:hypothetical protein